MEQLVIVLVTIVLSTALFVFWVAKGGFNRKYLYTDNTLLFLTASLVNVLIFNLFNIPLWLMIVIFCGLTVGILFILLLFYRFYRNPARKITGGVNDILSPADGRIIYIKELETNQIPVSVKRLRIASVSEITKTDLLEHPCYLIGIAMTLFDVHYNRAPLDGTIIQVKHTPGTAIGLNTPESTISNERMTTVFKRNDGIMFGVVQIAARGVRRCIVSVREGDEVSRGQIFGKIRWGSQTDLIIPRDCHIYIREGDQVHAGTTLIGKLNQE
jgi:phosphatidylserine decarboxylase